MKIGQDQEVAELLNKALIKAIKRYALTAVGMSSMADELLYIPNDHKQNNPFCRLQFVLVMFGHSTLWTNKSNIYKSPQIC